MANNLRKDTHNRLMDEIEKRIHQKKTPVTEDINPLQVWFAGGDTNLIHKQDTHSDDRWMFCRRKKSNLGKYYQYGNFFKAIDKDKQLEFQSYAEKGLIDESYQRPIDWHKEREFMGA